MGTHTTDPLLDAVQLACTGRTDSLHAFLERRGALPGPRPNLRLAIHAAAALVSCGARGLAVLASLRAISPTQAARDTAAEFLPLVGIIGLGVQAARSEPTVLASVLSELQSATEDPRPHVRASVVHALREVLTAHADRAVEALSGWTDGYLQGAAVLEAIATAQVLQHLKLAAPVVDRLQECFSLLEAAPRSHERTQGYRALVRVIGQAPAAIGRKFPAEIAQWLGSSAHTHCPELREAIEDALVAMRGAGVRASDIADAQRAFDASEPTPRDPRDNVGPTRSRGKKARRRGKH